jgi:hypothetical protein
MPTIGQLRKSAKEMGIAPASIRGATSAPELQALIMDFMTNGASTAKPARKPAKTTPARRGRPPKSTKSVPVKSKPAAKSTSTGKAKRSASANGNGDAGRHMLTGIDYTVTDGWNPREGSPPDLIIRALRRFKGNRGKVFDHLLPNVKNFVGSKMADGTKRDKASTERMLAYRISRTAWDFAMRTGQHEKSENRAEYGASMGRKPTKATTPTRKAAKATTKTTRRPVGRPRTAAKPATRAATTRKPGRPQKAAQKPAARTTTKRPVAKKKTTRR